MSEKAQDEHTDHWVMQLLPVNIANPSWRKNCPHNSGSSGNLPGTYWTQET